MCIHRRGGIGLRRELSSEELDIFVLGWIRVEKPCMSLWLAIRFLAGRDWTVL